MTLPRYDGQWVQLPSPDGVTPGGWVNTAGSEYDVIPDSVYQANVNALNPTRKYMSDNGVAVAPTQEMLQKGSLGVLQDMISELGAGKAASVSGLLGNQGFWNKFSDIGQTGDQIGSFTAQGQAAVNGGDFGPEGLVKANYIHLGNMVDDLGRGRLPGMGGTSTNIWGAPSDSTNQEISGRGVDPGPNNQMHNTARMAALAGVASYLGGGGGLEQGGTAPSGGIDWANTYASAGDTGVMSDAALADGGQFTGGFTGNVQGSPGFSGTNLGNPGLLTSTGDVTGTSLAGGFFPMESASATGGLQYGNAGLTSSGYQVDPNAASSTGTATSLGSLASNPQVIGAGLGAAAGLLGNSSGGNTGTVQTEEGIPDWLMPYVKPALDRYTSELQNYQVDPYGIMPSAMQQFKDTVGGMYLDPSTNKYLEDYYRLGAERIRSSLSPSFGHMQAFGQHSGYNQALSRGLGDFATGLYGGAYERERDRQNQMIAASPAFLGQSSQAAFQPYSQYLTSLGALGRKKEEPYYQNQFGNILGGAMLGSQFGKAFQ